MLQAFSIFTFAFSFPTLTVTQLYKNGSPVGLSSIEMDTLGTVDDVSEV